MASERTIQPTFGHARPLDRPSNVRRRTATFETESLSASTYLAALAASTDGVVMINRAGVVAYANPAAEAFFSDTSLTGQYYSDLSRVEGRALSGIWRELRRRGRWCGRLCVRTGTPVMDVTVQRVDAEANESEHYCVVLHGAARHDATETSRSKPSPLQRVASEIAHDFNNQIAVILNYSFVLLRHMPADSPLKAHVTEMQAAAWRASQVAQAIHSALVTHTLLPSLPLPSPSGK